MNARLAVLENKRLENEIFQSSKVLAERKGWTVSQAIELKRSVALKYAKANNEKCAINVRYDNALKLN